MPPNTGDDRQESSCRSGQQSSLPVPLREDSRPLTRGHAPFATRLPDVRYTAIKIGLEWRGSFSGLLNQPENHARVGGQKNGAVGGNRETRSQGLGAVVDVHRRHAVEIRA